MLFWSGIFEILAKTLIPALDVGLPWVSVEHMWVSEHGDIQPPTASPPTCSYAKLMSYRLQRFTNLLQQEYTAKYQCNASKTSLIQQCTHVNWAESNICTATYHDNASKIWLIQQSTIINWGEWIYYLTFCTVKYQDNTSKNIANPTVNHY